MKMKSNRQACLIFIALFASHAVWAQTTVASATVESTPEPSTLSATMDREEAEAPLAKKLILNYWGFMSGPSLGEVKGGYTPDSDGQTGDPVNFDGVITAGYKPTKLTSFSIGLPFLYRPGAEQGTTKKDAYLKFSKSNALSSGTFAMSLASRLYLPTTEASRDAGRRAGLRVEQNFTYDLPNGLQVAAFTYLMGNSFAPDHGDGTAYAIYAAPYLTYTIRDKLAATAWCDLVQLASSTQDSKHFVNAPVALQTGLSWDPNDRINLNPFVNVYPEKLSLNSSSVGLVLSLRAL